MGKSSQRYHYNTKVRICTGQALSRKRETFSQVSDLAPSAEKTAGFEFRLGGLGQKVYTWPWKVPQRSHTTNKQTRA